MENRQPTKFHRLGMIRAFSHRDFAVFASGNFAAALGFWVLRIALQWVAWEKTKSFEWLGALAMVQALTLIAAMPIAGALVDKFDRLKYGKTARLCEVLISLFFTALFFSGFDNVATIFLFAAIISFADGMWSPARLAILSSLVPREDYPAAFGTSGSLFYTSQFVGPAVAGLLIARAGVGYAFLFQAIMFSASLFAFFFIRKSTPPPEDSRSATFFENLVGGIRYSLGHRTISVLMVSGAIVGLTLRSLNEILAGFADDLFQGGAEGLATLASTGGAFALAAALYIGNFSFEGGQTKRILIGLVLALVAFAVTISTQNFELAVIGYGVLIFAVTIVSMSTNILIQNSVSESMRGRVMSLWGMVYFATPSLGAWIIGFGASLFGVRPILYGLAVLAVVLLVGLSTQKQRLLEAEVSPSS